MAASLLWCVVVLCIDMLKGLALGTQGFGFSIYINSKSFTPCQPQINFGGFLNASVHFQW